jgi:chromate transporter
MNVNEGVGAQEVPAPSLWELTKVYLGISLLGFGGPNAHLALMLDEIVERRGWLTRERFLELVAVTNLLPGPNSSEVAIHVGYTQRGWMGAMATGLAFLLPTFFMVTGLSALYFEYGALPSVEGLFWGIQPVIVAIVVSAGVKIGRAAVTNRWQVVFALCGAAVSLVSGPAIIVMMVVAGAVAMVGAGGMLSVFLTHLWIGSVLFGGGYVLVALLEPYAVGHYGWLDSGQFLDGVALTQAVPGPISTLSAFVGYAAAGVPGAVLGTLGIYLPAFASVLMSAPRLERLRDVPRVRSALRGVVPVTAGAVFGVGAGLTVAGVRDPLAGVLAIGALAATVRWQVSSLRLMGAGLCAGVLRMVLS